MHPNLNLRSVSLFVSSHCKTPFILYILRPYRLVCFRKPVRSHQVIPSENCVFVLTSLQFELLQVPRRIVTLAPTFGACLCEVISTFRQGRLILPKRRKSALSEIQPVAPQPGGNPNTIFCLPKYRSVWETPNWADLFGDYAQQLSTLKMLAIVSKVWIV